jgi:peptidoglycan/LPS O-acetylase OafA/YrhL
VLARVAGFVLGFGCWFVCLRLGVKSWEPHASVGAAIAGWMLMLLGTILFFVSTLGTPERYIPGWLAYLGRISYGLYIFHSLILYFVFEKGGIWLTRVVRALHLPGSLRASIGTAVVIAATFAIAHLSFQYFERPFLRLKERFTFVRAREEEGSRTANV